MNTFRYCPLQSPEEIRLVKLLPGAADQPLRTDVVHAILHPAMRNRDNRMPMAALQSTLPSDWEVRDSIDGRYIFKNTKTEECSWTHPDSNIPLESHGTYADDPDPHYEPQYEALSYVWGPEDEPKTLSIRYRDDIGYTTIPIRQNLAIALEHVRSTDCVRTLWIDALCINQQDISERNKQVPRMRYIFKNAVSVIFWLGTPQGQSRQALSTLEYLGKQVVYSKDNFRFRAPDAQECDWYKHEIPLPYDEATWTSLDALLNRPWSKRMWIVQEVELSNRFSILQCGHDTADWRLVRQALFRLSWEYNAPPNLRQVLENYRVMLYGTATYTLPDLLAETWSRQCSNPRDKIYGILSVVSPTIANSIKVDYSTKIAEVYTTAFEAYLHHTQRLDMMLFCNQERNISELPSWVPDWSQAPTCAKWSVPDAIYLASGISQSYTSNNSTYELSVIGVEIVAIESSSQGIPADPHEAFLVLHNIIRGISPSEFYLTGVSAQNAMISTLTMDYTKDVVKFSFAMPAVNDLKTAFLEDSLDAISNAHVRRHIMQYIIPYVKGVHFIKTQKGHYGLSNPGIQKGDVICVFLGCHYPMVLRPHSEDNTFEIIGPCYLQGVMFGEEILGPLPENWRVQVLEMDSNGHGLTSYHNIATDQSTYEDPRLGPVPEQWEALPSARELDDPIVFQRFRHKVSGKVINSDPRLSLEALGARGACLRAFRLR